MAEPAPGLIRNAYDLLTGDDEARVCLDIPDAACREQPASFFLHLASLSLTKLGDGLADTKLVLSWLLASLGAPSYIVGLLVPVRESLSLLPQLMVAAWIRGHAVRKWFWIAGSLIQAAALGLMALAALLLEGAMAGWAILALLALFSVGRGFASIAHNDVLGKTISRTRRGTVSGWATTVGSIGTGAFGLYMVLAGGTHGTAFFAAVLALAAFLWLAASLLYSRLEEVPGATEGGKSAFAFIQSEVARLGQEPDFVRFVLSRALFVSIALMPPFLVVLSQRSAGAGIRDLGLLVLASGIAGGLSSAAWGRFADRSSRQVMRAAAALAGLVALATGSLALAAPEALALPMLLPAAVFLVALAHAGIRIGRKTYIVDLAGAGRRAGYVALSNTLIGVVLVASGLIGVVAETAGIGATLLLLAALSGLGIVLAARLPEVQQRG